VTSYNSMKRGMDLKMLRTYDIKNGYIRCKLNEKGIGPMQTRVPCAKRRCRLTRTAGICKRLDVSKNSAPTVGKTTVFKIQNESFAVHVQKKCTVYGYHLRVRGTRI